MPTEWRPKCLHCAFADVSQYGSSNFPSQFCSLECKEAYRLAGKLDVAPSIRGAISELQVANDLMKRGYYVFHPLSPTAPIDLIAYKPGETTELLEVRTNQISWGARQRLPNGVRVAIVSARNAITYEPAFE